MSDKSDYGIPSIEPSSITHSSTPPKAKMWREIMHPILYVIILVISLLANRWEIKDAPAMSTVVYVILVINAALRKAEGSIDVERLLETFKR